ncbi:Putative RNA-binding protein Luc7-like 1 [Chamberlinius hualienensis]
MSAHEQMRMMLDQLMGTGRDGENNRYKVKFSDSRVCKSFLLGCCPHDILASTRMDLGTCPKIHDLALRADYEQAAKEKDYNYDLDAMEHLQAFISDCDRRTELAKRRLAETQEELSAEVTAKANKVHEFAEQIGKKLAKAEQLGAEGNVEESFKILEEVEDIRKKKSQAELDYRNSMPASSYQQQKLRVCEVCSAYLGIHDNDRRLADHFGGKLHLGFIKIREKLEELQVSVAQKQANQHSESVERDQRRVDYRTERDRERVERDAERERFRSTRTRSPLTRDDRRQRSRSRDRRDRDNRQNSRDRDNYTRDRDRHGHRDRRDRRERSRSRERPVRAHHDRRERRNDRSDSREKRYSDDETRPAKNREDGREQFDVDHLHNSSDNSRNGETRD